MRSWYAVAAAGGRAATLGTVDVMHRTSDMPTAADAARLRALRRMQHIATGLFVAVTAVFVLARWLERDHSGFGYLRAFAEAAMVGALADWFAVTALFRHPLGVPIPHTAI